ncbi:hypothetical protein [Streptomyces sp. KL116D]|uniref:hypothetical protein n=1 Tax=Streptomyces sp. KL116D TaxID=3045152 RepID=UPI003558C8AB
MNEEHTVPSGLLDEHTVSSPAPSHWIDGRAVRGTGPLIDVVNPADASVVATLHEGTAE